jgi:restriction system protein
MALPDYQALMLPILRFANRIGSETTCAAALVDISAQLKLSDEDLRHMLPSGTQSTITNRVSWAVVYMKKAGLLESTRRGFFRITKRGADFLKTNPARISLLDLDQFPEFKAFKAQRGIRAANSRSEQEDKVEPTTATPSEQLESGYQSLREDLADELLDKLKQVSPAFFERIVVELLVKMGYGGSLADAGRAIGKSGDGGIDGIIKEDKLGLDVIYIQAKRWDSNSVGRPDVQQFAGALQGQRANKGIFITTSRFTKDAQDFAAGIGSKIVLIDGEQLSQMMIDHDVGVSTAATYQVKRLDSDYFSEGV